MIGRRDVPHDAGRAAAAVTTSTGAGAPHAVSGLASHTLARGGSRFRSQSENALNLDHPAGGANGFTGGLLLDSDDEAEKMSRATTPPLDIGSGNAGISIPAVASASFASERSRFGRREFFLQGGISPTSSDDEDADFQMYSTSYAGPRDLTHYTFEMAQMTGYLEKQSKTNPLSWKRRWFVMQENALFYYRYEHDAIDTKPTDRTCCGSIQLDNVHSVTTAKDFGVGAFQIRVPERKYILRADTKECMHDWLFNFQKSIANIISVLLRSKSDHRFHRLNAANTRRSFSKVSRSVSLDFQDPVDFGRMSADFPSHHFQYGFIDSESFSDDSIGDQIRTSPRRASSPLNFSHHGPRSPVAIFAFDPPFESIGDGGLGQEFYGGDNGPLIEEKEGEDDDELSLPASALMQGVDDSFMRPRMPPPTSSGSPMLRPTFSPPVASGKYIPRFLRDRQNAEAVAPPINDVASPPRSSLPPSGPTTSFHLRASREKYAICTTESDTVHFDDNVSFTAGGESHGVTSLKGVRNKLEDVCCCVPDLNRLILTEEGYSKHSLYALFDGHCGIRAAKYLNEKLLRYLCEHEAFVTNARQAFAECFKRIDDEFLERASLEMMGDGSTAAVVLIRGNKLLTANVGDSRAVVSINGVALDVIEEQTPGRPDERERIERLGGWVKEERELQMSKLHSMDLSDPWIQQKAERVVRWISVYRVNGELAVSRAIGDMDYKGKALTDYEFWGFPDGHDRQFLGDLVVCDPEFKEIEITPEVRFLVLACDGLWDTITSQEAVNHVNEKLNEGYSTSQVSHSLADLAIRSGSSDNVSVIVVLFQH